MKTSTSCGQVSHGVQHSLCDVQFDALTVTVIRSFLRVLNAFLPISVVEKLTHEFKRWLSAVHLTRWHVHIVDENNCFLVDWWSVVTLASLVHP